MKWNKVDFSRPNKDGTQMVMDIPEMNLPGKESHRLDLEDEFSKEAIEVAKMQSPDGHLSRDILLSEQARIDQEAAEDREELRVGVTPPGGSGMEME